MKDNTSTYSSLIADYCKETDASFEDGLTGLFNHGFFQIALDREVRRSERTGKPFALGLLGIDSFGIYNRRHGSMQGDRALKDVARVISANIRRADLAARFSGDVFAVIFVESKSSVARVAAERIRHLVENLKGDDLTLSAGLATFGEVATSRDTLIQKAVNALAQAKARGKNRIHCIEKEAKTALEENKHTVLIVDDDEVNVKLLEALISTSGYQVLKAFNGEEAIKQISKFDVDLVLLDIMMPDMDGYEVCRRIKSNDNTRMIPVIALTALREVNDKIKAIEAGADDFLTKPPNKMELLARTRSLIRFKRLNDSLTSVESVLFSLAKAVEAKDRYTQGHIARVSNLGVCLGRRLGLSATEVEALRVGGILHDIGKIGIPLHILNKQGPPNEAEWEIIKSHCDTGYKICLPLERTLQSALGIVRQHHERLDGSGYPDGLRGDEISQVALVMAVADSYDALVTNRPYRKALSKEKALLSLNHEADNGKLDSRIVECLFDMVLNAEEKEEGEWDNLEVECSLDLQLSVLAGSTSCELSV